MKTILLTIALIITTSAIIAQNPKNNFMIDKITIGVTNLKPMEEFYANVFGISFKEDKSNATVLYSGELCNLKILLYPKEISNVNTNQNRHQFDFIVLNVQEAVRCARANGGKQKGEINTSDTTKTAVIIDPDGNTIVFVEHLK